MHDSQHDRWCAPLAADNADELPADLRREIDSCPECGERIAELRALRAGLGRAGLEQRDVFEAARALDDGPGSARFDARLRGLAREHDGPRRWRRRVIYAVAALLIGALGIWIGRVARIATPSADRGVLGDELVRLIEPTQTLRRGDAFVWESELPVGGEFRVHCESIEGVSGESFVSSPLPQTRWTPTDEEFERLPSSFDWFIERVDPGQGTSTFSATRRCVLSR